MKAPYSKKIVLIGPSAVGKTSIVLKLISGKYNPYSESTIGASFCSKLLEANDGVTDKVEIWDTAGQERYKSLIPMYYRNASGALVVYDVTDSNANKYIDEWITELREKADTNIKIIIVGNKIDLLNNDELNNIKSTKCFEKYNHIFVSAKTGENIEKVFKELVSEIPRLKREPLTVSKTIEKKNLCC